MQNCVTYSDTFPHERTMPEENANQLVDQYLALFQKSQGIDNAVGAPFTLLYSMYLLGAPVNRYRRLRMTAGSLAQNVAGSLQEPASSPRVDDQRERVGLWGTKCVELWQNLCIRICGGQWIRILHSR